MPRTQANSDDFVSRLRIGCVQYLNARPLTYGLPGDIVFDHPTELCRLLAEGKLDVALASSFEVLRNPNYSIVDDICISSDGPVFSVVVAHAGAVSDITEIDVDPASQTSVQLLRCLLIESGLTAKLVTSRRSRVAVDRRRAKLFIGDQAIRFREQNPTFQFWDLGEEWKKITGLPFVYALWLIQPTVSFPERLADCLRRCRDHNLRNLNTIIASQEEFSPEFCRRYFGKHLAYHFGPAEKEGFALFQSICKRHGILTRDKSGLSCYGGDVA